MKNLLSLILGIVLGIGGVVYAETVTRLVKPHAAAPTNSVVIKDTASTTEYAAAFVETPVVGGYAAQGGCLKIADSDGFGFTYLTVANGTPAWSTVGCGNIERVQ